MEVSELIKRYLAEAKMMQIATVSEDQPWICTVYFATDDDLNLYWLSLPSRRHSQEIEKNSKVAITIPVKFDKNPIIGIQAEGSAESVTDQEVVAALMKRYTERYQTGQDFYNNFIAGKNKHLLYKFTPKCFVLFDEVNFPDESRQEWKLSEAEGEVAE